MAPPASIDWSAISPRSRETVRHIVMRQVAGYQNDEIAAILNAERPELRHLALPERVSKTWIAARLRELREDILTSAPD